MVTTNNDVEVYKSKGYSNHPIKPVAEQPKKIDELEIEDPADAVIAPGAPCLHRACNAKYKDSSSRVEPCIYHPGLPLFHEGSKGWTCCKKSVAEFEVFMQIGGCKEGKHKFVAPKKDVNFYYLVYERVNTKQEVGLQCRYDWYQIPANVVVTIYAKGTSEEKSSIKFEERKVSVNLKFKDGQEFSKVLNLTGVHDCNFASDTNKPTAN